MLACAQNLPKLSLNANPTAVSLLYLLTYLGSKGKAADMMKESTRRKRTRKEMEEVKEFEESLKADRQQFLQETKRLKQERDELQD